MQAAMWGRAGQQAQWLLWQMGSVTVDGAATPQSPPPEPAPVPVQPAIRRSRYDAVIRRMQQAGQQAGTYTSWTQSTTQPSSGSPKAAK